MLKSIMPPPGTVSRAYYDDIHNSSMLIGPVGSGKTTTIIAKICRLALDQIPDEDGIARTRIGCVRATYPELWSATIDSWQTIFPPSLGAWKGSEGRRAHHAILLEENGKKARLEMDFIAIGDYGAESALRGYQATGFWLNEVDTLQRDTYEYVSGRAGRYPKTLIDENGTMIYGPSWAGLIMDLNAPDELSWSREVMRSNECKVYKQPPAAWPTDEAPMEARGEPPTWRSGPTAVSIEGTEWTTNLDAENLSHLPKDYYVKQIQASRDNKITRMIQNEPAASVYGTPVFGKSFRATYHVSENPIQPDPSRPILIGADAGRTPRAVIGQVRGTGQGVIFDEVCEDDMSAQNFGIRLRSYVNRRFPNFAIKAFCDPAAARVGDQDERPWMRIMTDVTGWQWRPAARFNNIGLRIEAVDAMLAFQPAPGSPGLLIDKRCRRLRQALQIGYRFTVVRGKDERRSDKPLKNDASHIADALQYWCLAAGGLDLVNTSENRRNPTGEQIRQEMRITHNARGGQRWGDRKRRAMSRLV